jgi:hypothetical protein
MPSFEILDNDWVAAGLALFVTLYALNLGRMNLPCYIKNLFKNTFFKILFLSLLLIYRFEKAPHVALVVALIFVLTLDYLSVEETKENFAYLEAFNSQLDKERRN